MLRERVCVCVWVMRDGGYSVTEECEEEADEFDDDGDAGGAHFGAQLLAGLANPSMLQLT